MGAPNVYFSRKLDGRKYMEGNSLVREFFKELNASHRVRILTIPPFSTLIQDKPEFTNTVYLCILEGHVLVEEKSTTTGADTFEGVAEDVFYITAIPYAIDNLGETPALIFQVARSF